MKKLVMAVTLACALSTTALAGNIHSTDVAAPAPPATSPVVTAILTIIRAVVR